MTVPVCGRFRFTGDHMVQMTTRVAVQPLDDENGRVDEALASLYSLFVFVRNLLDKDTSARPPLGRPTVDVLAINMLTRHLHPFQSRWHRRYSDWRADHPGAPESAWPDDRRFRDELRDLQAKLRLEAVAFARMSEYDDYLDVIGLSG